MTMMMMMTVLTGRAAILSHLQAIVILVVKGVPSNSKPGCFLKSKSVSSLNISITVLLNSVKYFLPSK